MQQETPSHCKNAKKFEKTICKRSVVVARVAEWIAAGMPVLPLKLNEKAEDKNDDDDVKKGNDEDKEEEEEAAAPPATAPVVVVDIKGWLESLQQELITQDMCRFQSKVGLEAIGAHDEGPIRAMQHTLQKMELLRASLLTNAERVGGDQAKILGCFEHITHGLFSHLRIHQHILRIRERIGHDVERVNDVKTQIHTAMEQLMIECSGYAKQVVDVTALVSKTMRDYDDQTALILS